MKKRLQRRITPTGWAGMVLLAMLVFAVPARALPVPRLPIPLPLKKEVPVVKKDLAHLIPYATQIAERYTDLQGQIADIFNPSGIQDKLVDLAEKLEDLSWEIRFLKTATGQNYNKISSLKTEILRDNEALRKIKKPVSRALRDLAGWNGEWMLEKKQLPQWRKGVGKDVTFGAVEKTFENLETTIDAALQLISRHLKPMLTTDQRIGELQIKIHVLNAELDALTQDIGRAGFRKKAPSMFSIKFYKQFDRRLWESAGVGIKTFIQEQGMLFTRRTGVVALAIVVWLVLALVVARSGRFLEGAREWVLFAERPVSTALFVGLTLTGILFGPVPIVWEPMMKIGIIIAVMRLAAGLVTHKREKRLVNQLAALLLITAFFRVVNIPFPVLRLFTLAIALLALVFCIGQSHKLHLGRQSLLLAWGLRLLAVVLTVGLVAGISGYATFAVYLLDSSLQTFFVALVTWMLFLLTSGAVELILFKSPFEILRRNSSVLLGRLHPIIVFCFAGLMMLYMLVVWQVFATKTAALGGLLSFGISLGSTRVSVGTVLVALAVLYAALLISRALQAVLLQEVLPRRHMERGVQFSIARLVHYAIFLIGFLMALQVLGFSLTNLTIIGGALGVGIGFGLQAIVNNFASGLILLFERPIKVGDTIQVDEEMAKVKHLGLRSTVIETYNNAEIVVPNSDLITNKVTNWTLSERRIRLKLPVGVAYGSDVTRVMEILMACAVEHEKVLKKPAPRVLFLEFGDSSLNFELRVWIVEFNNRRRVQSDLNLAIDRRFREAGIEIPFPQTDLHLRSVDESAAAALNTGPPPKDPGDPSA